MIEDVFKSLLKTFISPYIKPSSFEGEVVSVDQDKDTCVVQPVEGALIEDVRLRSVVNADRAKTFVVYPKQGSFVMVSRIHQLNTEFFVSSVDQVDKIKVDCDTIIINGGSNGGVNKWPDTKTELDKVKNLLTQLVTIINGAPIPEPGNGAPSALQAALKASLVGKTLPNFENLEDDKLKH